LKKSPLALCLTESLLIHVTVIISSPINLIYKVMKPLFRPNAMNPCRTARIIITYPMIRCHLNGTGSIFFATAI